jgi:hypothetical protein
VDSRSSPAQAVAAATTRVAVKVRCNVCFMIILRVVPCEIRCTVFAAQAMPMTR